MYDGAIDDTSVARAISYGVIMIALLAGAIIVSQQWWVGVGIPFGLAAGMEYLVRHSGTSDGLEILGEVVALVGGLAFVIPVSGLIGLVGIARWRRGRSG